MPRPFAPSRRNAGHKLRKALSAAATLSALIHAAAIGVLLTIRPVPYPAPIEQMIAASIEPEEVPDRPFSKEPSGAISGDRRANGSATALPSNEPGDVNRARAFSAPAWPTFKLSAQSPLSDALRRMLDCLAVEGSNDGVAARRRDVRPPCPFAGLPFVAAAMPSTNVPESNENGARAEDDYRHFKPERPMFDESLLPDKVPEADRALKSWLAGLFRR